MINSATLDCKTMSNEFGRWIIMKKTIDIKSYLAR